ncbi:MAG TPA: oligosaccharide flippase family protein [Acidiferrobacterales bacterium]|nr:oligosaccharide flippase family protein [Acidiferrobacterales bacterium]
MELREIYRYTGVLYGVNLVASFITFLVMIVISRAISKEALGIYGLFQAYLFMSIYMSGFGISSGIVKFIAGRQVDIKQMHTLLAYVLSAMAAVFLSAGAILLKQGKEVLGLAVLALPAYHVFDFSLSYARGHLWKNVEWSILLAGSLTTSILVVLLLQWFPDYRGPMYGQVLSIYVTAFGLLALFFLSTRGAERFSAIKGNWLKDFISIALPVFIASALFSLNDVVDRLIIEKFLGLEMVGEYFLGMSLFNLLDRPAGLLARVLLSHFSGSKSYSADPRLHIASVTRIIKINLTLLPLFALAIITILPIVLPHFLNKDYSNAFNILAIVSIVMVVKAFELVNSMLAIARNSPATNIYAQAIALIIYLPLAIVLIHLWGIFGIAVSVAVRWIAFSACQFFHMRRRQIATISGWYLARALVAYLFALSLFTKAPLTMPFVYLIAGIIMQLWTAREFNDLFRFLRPARLSEK